MTPNKDGSVIKAKIKYYFKETFRGHSKDEYREIFSRGLNEENSGITGAYPWLYVRAFFVLLLLFATNVLIFRITNNAMITPSLTFLGGITFIVPIIIFLYELYPKRDLSILMTFAVLVCGGTVASLFTQIIYLFVKIENIWLETVANATVEEMCKAIPAIIAIVILNRKNPYECFLIAASVGAGFSVIEDMGYIYYYSDKIVKFYSDIQAMVALFIDRGFSSFCSHILWTGLVGWSYSKSQKPFGSFWIFILIFSVAAHSTWNLPLDGNLSICSVVLSAAITCIFSVGVLHTSRMEIFTIEPDFIKLNQKIIDEAKDLTERVRLTNGANLTFALSVSFLSVIILLLCSLPIGVEYKRVQYSSKQEFIAYIEDGYNLNRDYNRQMQNPKVSSNNFEERKVEGELTYVIQKEKFADYDGLYYYSYYVPSGDLDTVSVALYRNGIYTVYTSSEYKFGDEVVRVFQLNADKVRDYICSKDGTITAVLEADKFEGYNYLMALCALGTAIAGSCSIVLISFVIKLRRVEDE